MLIIPAIDIIKGQVVRLLKGDFNQETRYSSDPVEMALTWQKKGARFLHLVDLEGAKYGEPKNKDVVMRIIKAVKIPCQVGGGLRNENDIEYFLKQGSRRVVLGTSALEDMDYLERLTLKFNEKIVVSIDFSGGKVAKSGWQEKTDLSPLLAAKEIQRRGVRTIVVTDISTDGTLKGPNIEGLKEILASVEISVIASGGVSSIEDIKNLKGMKSKNLEGVIVGRALYEDKVILEDALALQ